MVLAGRDAVLQSTDVCDQRALGTPGGSRGNRL